MKRNFNFANSINTKVLLFISLAVVFTVGATVGFVMYNLSGYAATVAKQDAVRGMEGLAAKLEELKGYALQNAVNLADNRAVSQAVENQDRAQLLRLLGAIVKKQKIDFVTVTDGNGKVLARTHEPQKFGDSVANQYNIQMALKNQSIAVIEEGTAVKLSARAGIPVKNGQGNIVGVISTGYSLDKPEMLDAIKKIFHTDVTLFLGDTRINTTIIKDGNRVIGTQLDPKIADVILKSNERYSGETKILEMPYITAYMPLAGPDNKTIGVIFAGKPLIEAYKLKDKIFVTVSVLTVLLLVLVISLISFYLRKKLFQPIHNMVGSANRLAVGDTDIQIGTTSNDEIGMLQSAFRAMAENIKEMSEAAGEIAAGDLSVQAHVKSDRDILSLSINKVKDTLAELTTEFTGLTDAMIRGRLDTRGDTAKFEGAYEDLMTGLNEALGSIVNNFETMASPVMFIDKNYNIQYINRFGAQMLGNTKQQLTAMKCYDVWKTTKCSSPECPCAQAMREDGVAETQTSTCIAGTTLDILCTGAPLKDRSGQVIGAFEFISDQTVIQKTMRKAKKVAEYQDIEVAKLVANLDKLAGGHLDIHQTTNPGDVETAEAERLFSQISAAINQTAGSLRDYISEISNVLTQMADGNLNLSIERDYRGDFNEIKHSLQLIINSFNEILGNFGEAADQVAAGSNQVALSSQALSQGSAEQASTMEEITASITEIAGQTKQNAKNAGQANDLAKMLKEKAVAGNKQMREMLQAMREINESSANIAKIIKVIDEIAFQTNILSLNAAVEAARAGQYGKGFAVVAEEVRNLAARSANAAKETTDLIEGSIQKVETGSRIANDTAYALNEIVEGVSQTSNLVGEIAAASNDQATGITQINLGISQVSQVTQSNTATAEESAASSEELSGQATTLKSMVQKFTLKSGSESIKSNYQLGEGFTDHNPGTYGKKKKNTQIQLDGQDFSKY